MAVTCFIIFGRIIRYSATPEQCQTREVWISASWLTPIFVIFDLASFFVQLLGMDISAGSFDEADTQKRQTSFSSGLQLLKVGSFAQMFCFGFFVLVSIRVLIVSRHWQTRMQSSVWNWKTLLWAVNVAAISITVRQQPNTRKSLIGDRHKQSIVLSNFRMLLRSSTITCRLMSGRSTSSMVLQC